MKLACVLDIEGVIVPVGIDFAYFLLDYLAVVKPSAAQEARRLVEVYDKYDDLRWASEYLYFGYSTYQTGTTPFYVLCICAGSGMTEKDVDEAAQVLADSCRRHEVILNISKLHTLFDVVYIASSSYHAFARRIAMLAGAKLSNVIALGCSDRGELEPIVQMLLNCGSRSEILNVCTLLYYIAKHCLRHGYRSELHNSLMKMYLSSIRNKKLSDYMTEKVIKQVNIAGSRAKARLVERLRREGYTVIFIGDSIVDVEAALKANLSIAVNPSSSFLAHSATFTVILEDYSNIIDILEHIAHGDISDMKSAMQDVRVKVYSKSEVVRNLEVVMSESERARRQVKERVKKVVVEAVSSLAMKVERF